MNNLNLIILPGNGDVNKEWAEKIADADAKYQTEKRENTINSFDFKFLVLDIDGVMTDGGIIYTEKGDELKKFNAKDGLAIVRLIQGGAKVGFISSGVSKNIIEIHKKMMQVSDINLDRSHFKKVGLHRNNLFYRFVLNIAYLIHENIVLDEKTGNYEFIDFIRDDRKMAGLFENFIRNFYKEHLRGTEFEVKPEIIKWNLNESDPFSLEYLPQMKTDISITSEKRKIIIDTKYYRECLQEYYNKETIISSNLYQIFTYVKNAEAQGGSAINCEGILIYPTVRKEIDVTYPMENHKISVKTINLNQSWRNISNDLMEIIN